MSPFRPLLLLRFGAALLLALFLAGCGQVPLFSELSEPEANEMMAILLQRDIPCTKTAGKEERWVLKVAQADFSRAVDLLRVQRAGTVQQRQPFAFSVVQPHATFEEQALRVVGMFGVEGGQRPA